MNNNFRFSWFSWFHQIAGVCSIAKEGDLKKTTSLNLVVFVDLVVASHSQCEDEPSTPKSVPRSTCTIFVLYWWGLQRLCLHRWCTVPKKKNLKISRGPS